MIIHVIKNKRPSLNMSILDAMVFISETPLSTEARLLEAVSFHLTFGKHAGSTIGELSVKPAGRVYLQWVIEKSSINESIKVRAKLAMDYALLRLAKVNLY